MKILIGMHHPKHFWMFKNLISEGKSKGWQFKILISQKDVLELLLQSEGLEYEIIGKNQPTIIKKIIETLKLLLKTIKFSKRFNPDFYIGQAFPHFSITSALRGKPYIIIEDTESVKWLHKITLPFSDVIITSESFLRDLGKKHIRINTFLELAYLHPNWFKPNDAVFDKLGLKASDKFVIIRFVGWTASHDRNYTGISKSDKITLIDKIKKVATPIISSEIELGRELKKYEMKLSPQFIMDMLNYAHAYIGEGATMASEAVIMGTPAIYINPMKVGYIAEEEKSRLLIYYQEASSNIANICDNISKILAIDKSEWLPKRRKLLNNKVDLTSFIQWFITDFPESLKKIQKEPEFQYKFVQKYKAN